MRKVLGATVRIISLTAIIFGTTMTMTAAASQAKAPTEWFKTMSIATTSGAADVIATGAFTAGGTTNVNTKVITFNFTKGILHLYYHNTKITQSFNRSNCLYNWAQRGVYTVSHGTGNYTGVTGSGTYTGLWIGVYGRNQQGKCSDAGNPLAVQYTITAHGPISGI